MQVEFNENNTRLYILRDSGDPKFGKDESWFYYRVKQALQKQGYDCIKKLAYKDGNLVDNYLYYIRDRKSRWYIYDNKHALRLVSTQFDEEGITVLICSAEVTK